MQKFDEDLNTKIDPISRCLYCIQAIIDINNYRSNDDNIGVLNVAFRDEEGQVAYFDENNPAHRASMLKQIEDNKKKMDASIDKQGTKEAVLKRLVKEINLLAPDHKEHVIKIIDLIR